MKKQNSQTVAAGVAGLAVGAAAGVALAALSDPKTRQQVKGKAEKLGQQAHRAYQKAESQARQVWKNADPQLRQAGRQIKDKLDPNQTASNVDPFPDLATKGGEATHQVEEQSSDQFRRVKDLMNH